MENLTQPSLEDAFTATNRQKVMAWGAHLFTASGAIWGLLSIIAISEERWIQAFGWMALAVFVDSFDGFLARQLQVKKVLPQIDGALLDNMVDYLNYVVVPTYFLYHAGLFPSQLMLLGCIMILLASAYQFSQDDAKTEDHYFKGFPSYWNFVVFYIVLLDLNPWINLAATTILSILVFVPIKYVYPSRTGMWHNLTMSLAGIWTVLNVIILIQYPDHARWMVVASFTFIAYYICLSLYATWKAR